MHRWMTSRLFDVASGERRDCCATQVVFILSPIETHSGGFARSRRLSSPNRSIFDRVDRVNLMLTIAPHFGGSVHTDALSCACLKRRLRKESPLLVSDEVHRAFLGFLERVV